MSQPSDARRPRRLAAATGLLGFGALLVVEGTLDPADNGAFYQAATQQPGRLTASALLLLASAVLTVPAIGAIVHQARDRGSRLGHVGAFFTLLGAMGHMALATLYLIMGSLAGGDPAQMQAFADRSGADPTVGVVALVLLASFGIGVTLLAWAAFRAGLVGGWAPGLVTLAVAAHLALPPGMPAVIELAGLAAIAVVFGWLGVRTLRMHDTEWDRAPMPEPLPAAL